MKTILSLFVLCTIATRLVAGDPVTGDNPDKSGVTYGGSFGLNVASGKNAMYYNGAPDKENNVVSILSNEFVRESVYQQVKDVFVDTIYPQKMTYHTAMSVAGFLGYTLDNRMTVFLQLEYMKLSSGNIVQFELKSPTTNKYASSNYYDAEIKAQESRVDISLGLHVPFTHKGYFNPFVEASASINFVKVISDEITFGSYSTSMVYATTYNQTYGNTSTEGYSQGGMGYGIAASAGVEGPLSSKMSYNMGVGVSLKKINLLADAGLTPHESLYLRFLF